MSKRSTDESVTIHDKTTDVNLSHNEISFLMIHVSQRIIEAGVQGVPRDHSSSVLRDSLFQKLFAAKLQIQRDNLPSKGAQRVEAVTG